MQPYTCNVPARAKGLRIAGKYSKESIHPCPEETKEGPSHKEFTTPRTAPPRNISRQAFCKSFTTTSLALHCPAGTAPARRQRDSPPSSPICLTMQKACTQTKKQLVPEGWRQQRWFEWFKLLQLSILTFTTTTPSFNSPCVCSHLLKIIIQVWFWQLQSLCCGTWGRERKQCGTKVKALHRFGNTNLFQRTSCKDTFLFSWWSGLAQASISAASSSSHRSRWATPVSHQGSHSTHAISMLRAWTVLCHALS